MQILLIVSFPVFRPEGGSNSQNAGDGTESLFLQILMQNKGEKPIRRRPLSASINRVRATCYDYHCFALVFDYHIVCFSSKQR